MVKTAYKRLSVLGLLAVAFAIAPAEARMRAPNPTPDSGSVAVALVDELEGGPSVSSVLVRRPAAEPRDVILLRRSDADGARLSAAVAMLMLRRQAPVTEETRIRLHGAGVPASWRANWLPRFENVVTRLRRAEPQPLHGVGSVPVEMLLLPPASAEE